MDDVKRLATLLKGLDFVPKHERMQQALSLPADKLTVYMQLYAERYTPMAPDAAASILLTEIDLQQV